MIDNNLFREISTNLDLNGPNLSFTTQPVGVTTVNNRSVTFIGIATATFPQAASNSGTIAYQWYDQNGAITDANYLTGAATTTLTISNVISPIDSNRQFYVTADYVPYQKTGNALNEPIRSNVGILTVYPVLRITTQPVDSTATTNFPVTFNCQAVSSDGSDVSYQWQLNGKNLVDGTMSFVSTNTTLINTYTTDTTISIPSNAYDVQVTVAGANGGDTYLSNSALDARYSPGGSGRVGTFTLPSGARELKLHIGNPGSGNITPGTSSVAAGGRGGPSNIYVSAGGGGATGVYDSTLKDYIIVAGSGGGAGSSYFYGMTGRQGLPGFDGEEWIDSSGSFSVSDGGNSGNYSYYYAAGGGGGGGAPGGAAGNYNYQNPGYGGKGGGSKYNSQVATFVSGSSDVNRSSGYITVTYTVPGHISGGTSTQSTNTSIISGSTTSNLTLSNTNIGVNYINCKISHPIATNSPIYSNFVNFSNIYPRPGINIEKYDTTTSIASVSFHDLQVSGDLTLLAQNQTSETSLISLCATEKDVDVEMEIYSGSGANSGSYIGGKGGFSKIRFTMKKNEEYTIAGLDAINNCPFVYRKGSLIAVCGKGGDAASAGSGGDGGGINISGASGGGRGGGNGGSVYSAGTLPSNGILGSSSTLTAISPDTKATGQTGGRVLPCPKGNYWISKGYSACADVGISQIYLENGTVVTNSGSIIRGFKSGYDIRQTAGKGVAQTSSTTQVSKNCTDTLTRSAVVTHVKTTGSSEIGTITVSGDSFDVRAFDNGCSDKGCRYYEIYPPSSITNLTSFSISDISTQSAGGTNNGVYLWKSFEASGTSFIAIFSFNSDGPAFCRSFRVTANQETTRDCSYPLTVTIAGGGAGGSGATGGDGGSSSGAAGGGGSGYTDGSVIVLSTLQGSNAGGAKIIIKNIPIKPILRITSDILPTYSTTAGNSNTFSVSVSDIGNSSGTTFSYQWYLSTNDGSSYNPISGETGINLTRYSTFYYSDNNHKFFCRMTAVNVVGTTTIDSNICTLTVEKSSFTRTDPVLPSSLNWSAFEDGNDANVGKGDWGGLNTGRTVADIPIGTGKFRIQINSSLYVRKSNSPSGLDGCTQGRGVKWTAQARLSIHRIDGTDSGKYVWSSHDLSKELPLTEGDGTNNWNTFLGNWIFDDNIELDPNYAHKAFISYNIGKYTQCKCNNVSNGSQVTDCRDINAYAGTAYRMLPGGKYAYTPAVYSYETRP